MQKTLQQWEHPTLSELQASIEGATIAIEKQASSGLITGGRISCALVEILDIHNLAIISDIHGDYKCLAQILDELSYERFLANARNKLVFLGDYIDRGSNSIGVLNLVCNLKAKYSDSIVLMRGNHEAPSEFPFGSHDFPFQLVEQFGESAGREIYRGLLLLFKRLSVSTIVAGKLLLVHGGLPTHRDVLKNFKILFSHAQDEHMTNSVLEELLWNDPRQLDSLEGWEDSPRGIGRHFGKEITASWLEISGTKCVIRGHEPCQGFRIDHDGKVLTLFSSREPYPSFNAAYLSIGMEELQTVDNAWDLIPYIRFPK